MAQLMRYHSWPRGPVDSAQPFKIHVNLLPRTASLLGSDGYGGAYDWGNMVLAPDDNTPDIQRQAIGALTHDTGVAVQTSYALSGSGAYNRDVPFALTNTFGFSNARYAYNAPATASPALI